MKRLLTVILILMTVSLVKGQVKVRPGIKSGLNLSNITNTTLDSKVGLYAGAFADVEFSSFYTLQPEMLYSGQGGKSTTQGADDLNINYLSIGIANKFFVVPDVGLYLNIGPSLDFNLGKTIDDSLGDEVTFFDFALFFGIGYEFDFGLLIETRFKHGLINTDLFTDGSQDDIFQEGNVLNTVFQFGAAYKFDF